MNRTKNSLPLLVLISFTIIIAHALTTATVSVDASNASTAKPTGNVTNTKYLAITEHSYVEGPLFTIINGTVVNNSTTPMNSVKIITEFYDERDEVITANSGTVDFVIMRPGDNSSFTVRTQLRNETIDHYRAVPGGDIGR